MIDRNRDFTKWNKFVIANEKILFGMIAGVCLYSALFMIIMAVAGD